MSALCELIGVLLTAIGVFKPGLAETHRLLYIGIGAVYVIGGAILQRLK